MRRSDLFPRLAVATLFVLLTTAVGEVSAGVPIATLESIAVTPSNPSVPAGLSQQFTATGTFSDGSTQDVTGVVTWSSNTPSVATVSNAPGSTGLATAITSGTTTIAATDGTATGSTVLTVTSAALVAIEVAPAAPSVFTGFTRQFTATGIFSDGSSQDLTAAVTWSSSMPSIATVSNAAGSQGLATGVAAGTTTITATLGTASGGTTLTVTSDVLVAIDLAPTNPIVAVGSIRFFTAIGTFSNGAARNLTQTATWSSSMPAVATVSNDPGITGRASALAPGTTEITATVGTVSGGTTLTVPSELCSSGPRTCKTSGMTSVSIRKETDPRRDEMAFTWTRGAATSPSELGDPTAGTQYTVCVWDHVGGAPTLVMEMVARAGGECRGRPCWRSLPDGGFRYKAPGLLPNGIRRMTLEPGPQGRSRVVVSAHGTPIPDPPMPFQQSLAITVQIVNSLGNCWGADYVSPLQKNTGQRLRAKERP
jgi:hypothetical protein